MVKHRGVPAAVDRADFNGFANYIAAHSPVQARRLLGPGIWTSHLRHRQRAPIPHTDEWTYEPETANLANAPYGWCLNQGPARARSSSAGVPTPAPNALMWQWSGGGGVRNGFGDFDQIDGARQG